MEGALPNLPWLNSKSTATRISRLLRPLLDSNRLATAERKVITRTYENFDLLIEANEDGRYRARVTSSPVQESPRAYFTLPFQSFQLENLLLRLDPGRSGLRRVVADPQIRASLELGSELFEAVFSEDIRLVWWRSQDVARAQGKGLRLRLRLTDAPAIAGLPWELLYDRRRNAYIAQSERTPLVRYLEVTQPPAPFEVGGALRILVVVSSPIDLPELDVEGEWQRLQHALTPVLGKGVVQLNRLPEPTMPALSEWLRHYDVNVLHFIGHGDFDADMQEGIVFFCDRYGRRVKIASNTIGPYLRDHDPLRLVFLNACQSARVDAIDPFGGIAQGLIQHDCTAVVAMQFPISDGAAAEFSSEFYAAVADGLPIDQAATSGRKAMLTGFPAEWATPVLFLRAPDGVIFDQIAAERPTSTDPGAPLDSEGAETATPGPSDALAGQLGLSVQAATAASGEADDDRIVSKKPTGSGGAPQPTADESRPKPTEFSIPTTESSRRPRTGWIIGFVAVCLLVAGYLWIRTAQNGAVTPPVPTVTPSITMTTAPKLGPTTVNVLAAQAWTDTRVACTTGLVLDIQAFGQVLHNAPDPASAVGPDGYPDPYWHQFNVDGLPNSNFASLIGSLDQAEPFFVGASTTFTCPKEGKLFLGINDKGRGDNTGEFVATITPRS